MAEIEAKVNMSLDDIIKMEKKKKTNPLSKRGGNARGGTRGGTRGGARGNARGARGGSRGTSRGGGMRGNMRGGRGTMRGARGNMRGRSRSRSRQNNNQRGQWQKFSQNNIRGGFANNRFNGNIKSNLTRSRSNLSLNRMNLNNSPRGNRGGFASRRGGKFGLNRSRSRTNLAFNNKPTFLAKNKGFLKRTSSMPDLRDPSSVYNRLGYQSPSQIAYRNRVKRAKTVLLQRQNKAMRMQSAFQLSPAVSLKNLSSLHQKQVASGRRYSTGGLHSDQIMRAQRRAQYEQKLIRMGATRSNIPATMTFMNTINDAYNSNQRRTAMSLYPTSMQAQSQLSVSPRQLPRGRSPFRQSLQNLKAVTKAANRAARRARSRSRSRANSVRRNNSVISLTDAGELEDRSFSEVMYSLSNNFGVTGRTLNDRFSLF